MSKRTTNLCNQLIPEAEKSSMSFRHASGIVKNGKMIAMSHNSNIRSRIGGVNMPSIHAEISALSNYLKVGRGRSGRSSHSRSSPVFGASLYREKRQCILRER
jgi:tRNA(Arg) A34 adenosine deaminase TadA